MTTPSRILENFPPARRNEPLVRGLAQRLGALIDAADLAQRLRALIGVVEWARGGADEAVRLEGRDASVGGKYARWMLLLDTTDRDAPVRVGFQQASEAVLAARDEPALHDAALAWRVEHDACRELMAQIHQRHEIEGVSVDVVYGLDRLDRCLTCMASMLEAPQGPVRCAAVHNLLGQLIAATNQDRSLRHQVRSNLQLRQRKIVERAGRTGEHYIAWTRGEYRHLCLAAAGGGLLTVLTAANKVAIYGLQAPLFVSGLLSGLNYAVSFLLLQAFGLILATKQPAMTAAALGTIMREHQGCDRLDTIVTYAAQIVRSQIAAAIANVLLVAIGAYAFSFVWQLAFGHPFFAALASRFASEPSRFLLPPGRDDQAPATH